MLAAETITSAIYSTFQLDVTSFQLADCPCKSIMRLAEVISIKVGQDGEPEKEGEAEGGGRLDVGQWWIQQVFSCGAC